MSFIRTVLLAIKNEIQTDPASVGYAGKSPGEQAAMMNTARSQSPQVFAGISVNPQLIAEILIKRRKWEAVKTAADTIAAAGHADAFLLYQASLLGSVVDDWTGAQLANIISNLVTVGVLTNTDQNAIVAVVRQEILRSRADIIGAGQVGQGDVELALVTV